MALDNDNSDQQAARGACSAPAFARPWVRRSAKLALLLVSLTVSYGVVEWLLFTHFLHLLPSGLQGSLPIDIEPLSQSSKRGTLPRDYVALLAPGDTGHACSTTPDGW